jgi:chemotaxis protein CheY-P-specific phosphatase CheC
VHTEKREEIQTDVLCNVLEEFAFLFPVPVSNNMLSIPEETSIETSTTFNGPDSGQLILLLPTPLCEQVAANVLGIDPGDPTTTQRCHDAAQELLNIICGQLLTAIYGEQEVFNLSPPSSAAVGSERWQELKADKRSLAFSMAAGSLLFCPDIDGG